MEVLLYLLCLIFPNYLNVSPAPAVVSLPSSLPTSFAGIVACLQSMYAIPMSYQYALLLAQELLHLTQLCCSLGAQPEFPWATERGSWTLLLYDFKSDAGSPTSLNK